jgi:plastocyanin
MSLSSLRFACIVSLGLLASACNNGNNSSPTGPTPPPGGGSTVTITNNAASQGASAFGANPLTVSVNSTVVFKNSDTVAHTATADDAGGFNTGNIAANATASVTFNAKGTFKFHCTIHPGMTGTIIVM